MLEKAGTNVISGSAPWRASMAGNTEDRHLKTVRRTGNIAKTTAFHRLVCVHVRAPVFCIIVSNEKYLHV